MKNKFKVVVFVFLTLCVIFTITGCGKKTEYTGNIISFKYYYGSYNSGYYEYNINVEDDKVIFIAKGYNGVALAVNKEIDSDYLKKLSDLINDNKLYEWDGFDRSDKDILDGYGFTLEVNYNDNTSLKANGYMKYPKNYNEIHPILSEFLKTIK